MPPRYVYWTILAGGLPTAFRAADRNDLLPTFKRILEKHPDAEMKYFARGRLWNSPEEARQERLNRPPRPADRNWRPGGDHRDPRQPFKDAKKARNQRWREERFERRKRVDDREDRPRRDGGRPAWKPKPARPSGPRPAQPSGPRPARPSGGPKRSFGAGKRPPGGKRPYGGNRPYAGKRPAAPKPFTRKRRRDDDES